MLTRVERQKSYFQELEDRSFLNTQYLRRARQIIAALLRRTNSGSIINAARTFLYTGDACYCACASGTNVLYIYNIITKGAKGRVYIMCDVCKVFMGHCIACRMSTI